MDLLTVLEVPLLVDVAQVQRESQRQREIDVACCPECAVFAASLGVSPSLAPLEIVLRQLGLDPRRPDEVWGAADGGFLEGWWSFTAELAEPGDTAQFESSVELAPGLSAWISPGHSVAQLTLDHKRDLLLEFHWEGSEITNRAFELFPDLYRDAPA